ncbi:MAG: ferritin family protein [Planctomycetota bacterium]|jgi:rubrerythrin
MSIRFSADEILEMAEQIERNGAKFYRLAAKIVKDPDGREVLLELAAMEDRHEEIFASMRAALRGRENEAAVFDPDGEAALHLGAMADAHVFDPKADPSEELDAQISSRDIMHKAIGREKDAIVFFVGLKDFVCVGADKDKVEAIITEEMSHITLLSSQLAWLK